MIVSDNPYGSGCCHSRQRMGVPLPAMLLMVTMLLITGCASVSHSVKQHPHEALIATDLVGAMVQLAELDPITTTLQYSQPTTAFGVALLTGLEQAGYGLQQVSVDHGPAYVSYAMRYAETNAGVVTDYLVQVGDIELRREYQVSNGQLFPGSLLFITGARDTSKVIMNPALFTSQRGVPSFLSGIQSAHSSPSAIREITPDSALVQTSSASRTLGQQLADIRSQHVWRTVDSLRTDDISENPMRRALQRLVLVQPAGNGPFLGEQNKDAIRTLLNGFKPGDEFVLSACGANKGAADLKKQQLIRISEALLYAGVARESIRRRDCGHLSAFHGSGVTTVTIEHRRPVA